MNVYVSVVELGRPTMLLATSLQVKAHTFQINLVNLVELRHILLGLLWALDKGRVLLTHTTGILQPTVDPMACLEQSWRMVVRKGSNMIVVSPNGNTKRFRFVVKTQIHKT